MIEVSDRGVVIEVDVLDGMIEVSDRGVVIERDVLDGPIEVSDRGVVTDSERDVLEAVISVSVISIAAVRAKEEISVPERDALVSDRGVVMESETDVVANLLVDSDSIEGLDAGSATLVLE